jgi:AcrR family transcriptional regulator
MGKVTRLDEARPGARKRDAEATRAAILEAAKRQFAATGYDLTGLREIAAEAGVDVALIKRYFGGKEPLFIEALKASFAPERLRTWDRANFAQDVAERMAESAHAGEEATLGFQFLLRTATSPTTAPLLSIAIQERFLGPIRDWLGGPDVEARARVLAAIYIGLLVERLIRNQPLRGREREVFIAQVKDLLERMTPPL